MSESRDHLDQWLDEPVHPLLPPPGTFELVRKRARRRKVTHAALSATAVAAVVALGVTIPRLISPAAQLPSRPLAGSQTTSPANHSGTTRPAVTSSSPVATSTGGSGLPPVPPNFQVSSVTFVGQSTGWVLGQAGTPGQCTGPNPDICTSIARTDSAGHSWYGVPAPVDGVPNGSTGVSQIRFLNTLDGWAFGPDLWVTHNGGETWTPVRTGGARVTDLETVGDRVFAVWAQCGGGGANFAAGCTRFSLYSSPAAVNRWTPVRGMTGLTPSSGGTGSAFLALTGSRGYLMGPGDQLYSGPVSRGGGWGTVAGPSSSPLPCAPGPAQASGVPSQAFLAANGTGLVLLCPGASSPQVTHGDAVFYSTDGGDMWQQPSIMPLRGTPTSLSASVSGAVIVATTRGIEVASSPSGPWQAARGAPPGGVTYVGMTEASQGIAVAARQSLQGLWFTFSAGLRWGVSRVR